MHFSDDQQLVSFVIAEKLPSWQRKLFDKFRDEIQVHSQGILFKKVDRLFPNEHPDSKAHRLLAYESITESSFMKGANNVHWVFQNTSYKLICSENTAQQLSETEIDNKNIYSYLLDEWVKVALTEDANSLLVVYPDEYIKKFPKTKKVTTVLSENVMRLSDDIIIFRVEEESQVNYDLEEITISNSSAYYDQSSNGVIIQEAVKNTFSPKVAAKFIRSVYHVFNNDNGKFSLIRIQQLEEAKDYTIEEFPLDFIPVDVVGGEKVGKHKVYKSFLFPFVSFGNLALLQHSQHISVNLMFAFPRMDEVVVPCPGEGCADGRVACEVSTTYPAGNMPCPVCMGAGSILPQSPYKIYRRKLSPDSMEGSDEKLLNVDSVKFYTPETAILTYSKKEWQDYLERAESAVYIQQRVKTGNVESADSKKVDAEDKYTFHNRVSAVYYDKVRFVAQCFENYLNANPANVIVESPKAVAILTAEEAFAMLNDIIASNLPVYVKAQQIDDFMNKYISQSSPVRKFYDVLKSVDILLYYNNNEMGAYSASNLVSREQQATHVYAFPVLQQMYVEDKKILDKDIKALKAEVEKRIAEIIPAEVKPLKTQFGNA